MQARRKRSHLGWLEKRLCTGGARTRAVYASWRRLRNRKELALRRHRVADLAGNSDMMIEADRGYTIVPAGRIPEADAIAETTRRLVADALRDGTQATEKKPQLMTGLLPEHELTLNSPFIRFALRADVLRCVSNYLGAIPLLADVDVWASLPSARRADSQLYHCDWADLSQVKVFVHGDDIDAESGPLVVLGAAESAVVRARVGYRWRGERYRIDDQKMASTLPEGAGRPVLGPAGTVALVDTCRCFHYGSRLSEPGASRALCVMRFSLPSAFSAARCPDARAPFRGLATPALSAIERMVLGQAE